MGFIDDVNVLAYSTSTEENCKTLERLHKECERWAIKHGSVFAPDKYELIRLAKNSKNFNMTTTINISSEIIKPKADIRVLGLQIDCKLKWNAHIRQVQEKMTSQTLALTKLTASTWGASFTKARHVYIAVIRPAMTYGSAVWHSPPGAGGKLESAENKLSVVQNRCLRKIAGAYKATPIRSLEAETHISPISLHLSQLQAKARERLRNNGQAKLIAKACKEVAYKLRNRTGPTRRITETPGRKKHTWSKELVTPPPATPLPCRCPPWELETEEHSRSQNIQLQARRNYEKAVKKHFEESWRKTWRKDQDSHSHNPTVAQISPLDHKRPRIHGELARAESSLCTQIRTEKIGFAAFLHKQHVPDVTSPACHCGWERQTAKHVILYCKLNDIKEHLPRSGSVVNYRDLLNLPKWLKVITSRLMQTGFLTQYAVAVEQLYN